ncbi:hypothetical protein [Lysobacter sp. CA199]|uniref:hypothetical protein n=1 Tax=Lysobacter sp. CA199 TaxID=3455608 RepID=UPI003F8CFE53
MSSDNQFTALGPAAVGFQTNGSNIDRGAEIQGKTLGVRGEADEGVGVLGVSNKSFGVSGESLLQHGVLGTSEEGVGVMGRSGKKDGVRGFGEPGMLGLCVSKAKHMPNGVMGLSEGSACAGVFGGHRSFDADNPLLENSLRKFGTSDAPGAGVCGKSLDVGVGVMGHSRHGHGVSGVSDSEIIGYGVMGRSFNTVGVVGIAGDDPGVSLTEPPPRAGVYGYGKEAVGVMASSESNRGGHFKSAKLAQIHLVPMKSPGKNDPNGLVDGKSGDLLALENDDAAGGDVRCSLWFCVGKNPGSGAAQWVLIAA